MLEYLFIFYIFIHVFNDLLKGYIYFKDTKYFVPGEDSTSLHSLLVRCADWCDFSLSHQVTLKDNCYAPAHMITHGTDK